MGGGCLRQLAGFLTCRTQNSGWSKLWMNPSLHYVVRCSFSAPARGEKQQNIFRHYATRINCSCQILRSQHQWKSVFFSVHSVKHVNSCSVHPVKPMSSFSVHPVKPVSSLVHKQKPLFFFSPPAEVNFHLRFTWWSLCVLLWTSLIPTLATCHPVPCPKPALHLIFSNMSLTQAKSTTPGRKKPSAGPSLA